MSRIVTVANVLDELLIVSFTACSANSVRKIVGRFAILALIKKNNARAGLRGLRVGQATRRHRLPGGQACLAITLLYLLGACSGLDTRSTSNMLPRDAVDSVRNRDLGARSPSEFDNQSS